MIMMDRGSTRFSGSNLTLQQKKASKPNPIITPPPPDLTDFMNDMFFGTVKSTDKKSYNLTGGGADSNDFDDPIEEFGDDRSEKDQEPAGFDDSIRSNSSRLTQEWLEEAKRMIAMSPARSDYNSSTKALASSPRFAANTNSNAPVAARLSFSAALDRRDPLSRSARRHRPIEGFSEEILTKSTNHTRNKSATLDNSNSVPNSPTSQPLSPASHVQNWFSNILKPSHSNQSNDSPPPTFNLTAPTLPPRQSSLRRSRFQTDPSLPPPSPGTPSRRTFKPAPLKDAQVLDHPLSPGKNILTDSAPRKSFSSSQPLSPPRKLVESANRRSISRSTCSVEKIGPKVNANGGHKEEKGDKEVSLNGFLEQQRIKIDKILNGEIHAKAKIILSAPSNSTASMVAAICYAWLLQNRLVKGKGEGDEAGTVVVPVMNLKRQKMWKQRQAAWLFSHLGLDAASLLFADEVDLESLMMAGRLNLLVVGQDILINSNEVGSQCTILTDNYCEDAYDLLETPVLKRLLLAGILLDTQNLKATEKLSMTRDAEAVQLLLVGSAPNYRSAIFNQLIQDQKDNSFFEALRLNYGRPPSESGHDSTALMDRKTTERKSTSVSSHESTTPQKSDKNSSDERNVKPSKEAPKSVKPEAKQAAAAAAKVPEQEPANNSRGKNKFFLAKWFGFGSK